jgi:ASTRA-associated protein 1
MKPLGTLKYHKSSVQALELAHYSIPLPKKHQAAAHETQERIGGTQEVDEYEDEDEMDPSDRERRRRWLVAGGKDGRVSIWELMSFEKTQSKV